MNFLRLWPAADKFADGLLSNIEATGTFEKRAEVWEGYLEHCILDPKLKSIACGDEKLRGLEWSSEDVKD